MDGAKQTLVSGNLIIIIFDLIMLGLFWLELFLYKNQDYYQKKVNKKKKFSLVRFLLLTLATSYKHRGLLTVSGIFLVISGIVIINYHLIIPAELIKISISFIIFVLLIFLARKRLIRKDHFQDDMVSRYVDLVLYIILGHWFVLISTFIEAPTLPLGFLGLGFALILTFSVMVQAIANPSSIRSSVSKRRRYQKTASILKGMLLLISCELMILYLMVYNCYIISPDFYYSSINRLLDAFDMFYYLIVSFATMGYGDIHPIRFNGQIYSELVGIVIGLSSMFSTACFVAAVVAGAASIGQEQKKDAIIEIKDHFNGRGQAKDEDD